MRFNEGLMTLALVLALMAAQATFVPVTAENATSPISARKLPRGMWKRRSRSATCTRPGVCCHRTRRRRPYGIGGLRTRVTPARR